MLERNFTDLVVGGMTEVEQRRHLTNGGQTAITLRIPKNLKEAAQERGTERHEL